MEIARSKKGISGMLGCKPSDTPIDPYNKPRKEDKGSPTDRGRYQRLVGKLIYLSHTRPDIAFAVSMVSQYMQSPYEIHMEVVYQILRYLKMTPGKGLYFKKNHSRLIEAFTNVGSVEDRRSTSGYCTFVWGNLVTWRSKK